MRESHWLRAGCADFAAFRSYVGRLNSARLDKPLHVEAGPANGQQLLAQLKREYRDLLATLIGENRRLERKLGIPFVSDTRFHPGREAGAFVSSRGDRARIDVQCGIFLALDDALLTASTIPRFGLPAPEDGEATPHFPIATCGPETSKRYFDYRDTTRLGPVRLARSLTNIMPLDIMRLAQVDLLLGFAVQWVLLHEQAHELLGHLRWRGSRYGAAGRRIDEARFAVDGDQIDEDYCLELQADNLATYLMVSSALLKSPRNCRRLAVYARAAKTHRASSGGLVVDISRPDEMFRVALLAAGVAPLLFELRRERLRVQSRSHPLPAARILNVFISAVTAWGNVVERNQIFPAEVDFDLDSVRPAYAAALKTFVDLEIVARLIRLSSSLYLSEAMDVEREVPDNADPLSPLAWDFAHLAFEAADPGATRTIGGTEYLRLRAQLATLAPELDAFADITMTPVGTGQP